MARKKKKKYWDRGGPKTAGSTEYVAERLGSEMTLKHRLGCHVLIRMLG